MKLWIVCFVMLFGAFELYQWICQVSGFSDAQLSLPIAVAGGIGLAIASNYDRASGLPFNTLGDGAAQSNPLSPSQPMPLQTSTQSNQPCKRSISFQILTQPKRSISFEISKPSDRDIGH